MKKYPTIGLAAILTIFLTFAYLQLDILAPFLIAFVIAYLLQPLSDWCEIRLGLKRPYIAMLIIGLFILFITVISFLVLPFLYDQISLFLQKFPIYKENINKNIIPKFSQKLQTLDPASIERIKQNMQAAADKLLAETFTILNNIWSYTISAVYFFATIALVPFILYYFIRDWKQFTYCIKDLVPIRYKENFNIITHEINDLLAAYIRGQLNICLLLSLYYTTALTMLGLDFALLLGIVTGFLIIIPFIGFSISLVLSLLISYFAGNPISISIYIILLYIIGHTIEVYIFVPRMMGKSIGLNPVWIIFAVFALGAIYGIVGIVFAIPAAGIIKILLQHVVRAYKKSALYNS